MSNNPKLQDMGEHAKQLLGLIQECKQDANLELLIRKLEQLEFKLSGKKISTLLLIHDNQTVTDYQTGLMWKRQCEPSKYTYHEAVERFKGNDKFVDYNDWRLPTIDELETLVLKNAPYIDKEAFPDNPSRVWSSSPDASDEGFAWDVYFGGGYSNGSYRNVSYSVRLVRGGQ